MEYFLLIAPSKWYHDYEHRVIHLLGTIWGRNTLHILKKCVRCPEWLDRMKEKMSAFPILNLCKKSVFFPVTFTEWKIIMSEWDLEYFLSHQLQLHFFHMKMCCKNILGQTTVKIMAWTDIWFGKLTAVISGIETHKETFKKSWKLFCWKFYKSHT